MLNETHEKGLESTGWEAEDNNFIRPSVPLIKLEDNPKKLKIFYNQFCKVIEQCKYKNPESRVDEINILEVLVYMKFEDCALDRVDNM